MKLHDILNYSSTAIFNRKKRSIFTVFGVVVGIAAIISLLALGNGLEKTIDYQFELGFPTDTVTISKQTTIMSRTDFEVILFVNDTSLVEEIEDVELAVAVIQKQVLILVNDTEITTIVYGIDFNKYATLFPNTFNSQTGSFPEAHDDTIILGESFFHPWGNDTQIAEIGNNITLQWVERTSSSMNFYAESFEISGILEFIGAYDSFGAPSDSAIYMDIKTAQDIFETEECSMIIVKLADDTQQTIEAVSQDIREIFGDDVGIITLSEMRETIDTAMTIITYFLAAIGGISLFVAGIGIMNVMHISVLERTREIGILKAMGTKDREIFSIFILEAFLIGLVGAILGIILGILFAFGATAYINRSGTILGSMGGEENSTSPLNVQFSPVFSFLMIFEALMFGLVVSVIFGFLPARKAARMLPVDAIRYE
jgi:putative ABC transport system permease protein